MLINVHQAKARLSELLERVARGEEVVIVQGELERVGIVTGDPVFANYGAKVIWR